MKRGVSVRTGRCFMIPTFFVNAPFKILITFPDWGGTWRGCNGLWIWWRRPYSVRILQWAAFLPAVSAPGELRTRPVPWVWNWSCGSGLSIRSVYGLVQVKLEVYRIFHVKPKALFQVRYRVNSKEGLRPIPCKV